MDQTVPGRAAGAAGHVISAYASASRLAKSETCELEPSTDALDGIGGKTIDFGILALRRRRAMSSRRVIKNPFDLRNLKGAAFSQSKEQRLSHGKGRKCCSFRLHQSLLFCHAASPPIH